MAAYPVRTVKVGEIRRGSVDLSGKLDEGELLTGTPTAEEIGTSDLLISDVRISTAPLRIAGREVPPGRAIQFLVAGQQAIEPFYVVRITCPTTAGQLLKLDLAIAVEA